jgi:hypothetical protein
MEAMCSSQKSGVLVFVRVKTIHALDRAATVIGRILTYEASNETGKQPWIVSW